MKLHFFHRTGDKIVFWCLIGLTAVILIASALHRFAGLALVHGELYLFLPMLIVYTLLGWGLSAIIRRLKKPAVRSVVAVVLVLVMLVVGVIGLSYGSVASSFSFPQKYVTVASPDAGHRLVVMRGLDLNEERIEQRRAARVAADPEATAEVAAEDWGYVYTAYAPGPLGLFYRVDTLLDGEVHIGYGSKAELMVEWEDDETVGRFYVKNPELADGGEMRARAA